MGSRAGPNFVCVNFRKGLKMIAVAVLKPLKNQSITWISQHVNGSIFIMDITHMHYCNFQANMPISIHAHVTRAQQMSGHLDFAKKAARILDLVSNSRPCSNRWQHSCFPLILHWNRQLRRGTLTCSEPSTFLLEKWYSEGLFTSSYHYCLFLTFPLPSGIILN